MKILDARRKHSLCGGHRAIRADFVGRQQFTAGYRALDYNGAMDTTQNNSSSVDEVPARRVEDFETATISLFGTVHDSIVDGPGLRYAVFVQGCSHGCPGCHNPESQPACGGTETRVADVLADIEANGLVHDVTLSGGEPFEQPAACAALAAELKARDYGIWCYTGYLYEDLARRNDEAIKHLLENIDVLVDGPFVEARKSLELKWCGSSNQRLIDVPATRRAGHVVEWQPVTFSLEKPSNW